MCGSAPVCVALARRKSEGEVRENDALRRLKAPLPGESPWCPDGARGAGSGSHCRLRGCRGPPSSHSRSSVVATPLNTAAVPPGAVSPRAPEGGGGEEEGGAGGEEEGG